MNPRKQKKRFWSNEFMGKNQVGAVPGIRDWLFLAGPAAMTPFRSRLETWFFANSGAFSQPAFG
jgi:hypothetical protein